MSRVRLVKPSQFSNSIRNIFLQSLKGLGLIFIFSATTKAASLPAPMSLDWGAQTYSFAGAGSTMVTNQDAMLTNPANLVFFSGSGSLGGGWLMMPGDQSQWSVGIVDGSHDLIGGFQYLSGEVDTLKREAFNLDLAYKTPYGSLGITGHALKFSGVPAGKGWHFSQSIGILVPIAEMFTLGIYSKSPYDIGGNSDQIPPSIHLGLMYSKVSMFRASFESGRRFRIPNQDWYYAAAGDFLLQEYFAVRGGYRWEHKSAISFWSAGAALIAPKIDITAVYVRASNGPDLNGYGFDISFKF